MINDQVVEEIILKALANVKEEQGPESRLSIHPNTPLFSSGSAIDSLSLVSLIVDVESEINGNYQYEISLTDDRAMSRPVSPFTDVQALKTYILELITEQ
jgi:acyl carrier protein